jgi:chromosome segregation ATPase
MSEERLARVEAKVDDLQRDVSGLKSDVAELKSDNVGLRSDGASLRAEVADLRREVRTQGEDIRREMRILHEDVIGRIAALAPDFGPIRREFKQADAELRESIERRLDPLEAAIRSRRRQR